MSEAADRKLLKTALDTGRALEDAFARQVSEAANDEQATSPARELAPVAAVFKTALLACAAAENPLIQRLSELAPKVSIELGSRHLMTLLVPIERLMGRSARDEEFLFHETDGEAGSESRLPRIAICENIRSAFNVGAIFRSTEAFGGTEVWLAGYSPEPMKTAMGTDEVLTVQKFDRTLGTGGAIEKAKREGYAVIALENAPGAIALDQFEWPEKAAIIVGNERFGVDSETLAACDHIVRVETRGRKNSINVGVAFGVAAASWARSTPRNESPNSDDSAELIKPIGFVRGGFENPQVAPRQGAYDSNGTKATIELVSRFEGRPSNFSQALQDLDGFERAWVLFGFHESQGWLPQVRPPRGDGTKRGLFATRSPHRPNRLGISCVRIAHVDTKTRTLEIAEHDLLEGTPIYDVKPYVPGADAFPNAKAGWLDEIKNDEHWVVISNIAREALDWLELEGETRLQGFIDEQLRYQPFDSSRKRVSEYHGPASEASHTMAFRTWRLDFKRKTDTTVPTLEVLRVRSGYSPDDLASTDDPYSDKDLHRRFLSRFK